MPINHRGDAAGQRRRLMADGKYMYTLAKQGKMKSPASLSTSLDFYLNVFFLFPSSSPAILCALSSTSSNHRKKTPVSKIKLTSSPLAVLPSDTWFFSLRLWRIGVEGTVSPPTQYKYTGWLLQRQCIYIGLIGMPTHSLTVNHTCLSVGDSSRSP